jgi:hypothetical protein
MHILDENFRPGRRTSVNRYAIFSAGRLALIETDTDPHAAAATRKQVLDMVAADRQLVAGMHMHYPGFAHVVRQGDSYLMLLEPWDQAF